MTRSGADEAARQPVVLVIEDEPLLRRTTAEFLRLSGYTVIETADSAQAMAVFSSGKSVDVVFSDVCLSAAMDGLTFARWLQQQYPGVPVILASGYGDAARQAAIELVGNESFLSKPYRQQELAHRIRLVWEKAGPG